MAYTKPTTARKPILREEAKLLIVSARIFHDPDEVIAYHCDGSGTNYRAYSLPLPPNGECCRKELLEYARNNIPDELHF